MESKLLPCPFCGKTPTLDAWGKVHVVAHDNCPVVDSFSDSPNGNGFGVYGKTEQEAIERWNTRAETTCHVVDANALGVGICDRCGKYAETTDNYCPHCRSKVVE